MDHEDYVVKRNGEKQVISFDKILTRIKKLSKDVNLGEKELNVNYTSLAQKIIDRIFNGIKTTEIDELTAQQCASLSTVEPDYGILASRIMVSNLQKNTNENYSEVVQSLYGFKDIHGKHSPLVSERFNYIVQENKDKIFLNFDASHLSSFGHRIVAENLYKFLD